MVILSCGKPSSSTLADPPNPKSRTPRTPLRRVLHIGDVQVVGVVVEVLLILLSEYLHARIALLLFEQLLQVEAVIIGLNFLNVWQL